MATATIFQRFNLVLDDSSYTLRLKQTVTIKPDGFYIRAYPRKRSARLYTTPSSAKLPAQINHVVAAPKSPPASPADCPEKFHFTSYMDQTLELAKKLLGRSRLMLLHTVSDCRSELWTRLLKRSHRTGLWSSSPLLSRVCYSQF